MAEHNTTDQAHGATEHVMGTMDIREQQKTFTGFMRFSAWSCVAIGVVLVFLALSNA